MADDPEGIIESIGRGGNRSRVTFSLPPFQENGDPVDVVFSEGEDDEEADFAIWRIPVERDGAVVPREFRLPDIRADDRAAAERDGKTCGKPDQYWALMIFEYGLDMAFPLVAKEIKLNGFLPVLAGVALDNGLSEYRRTYRRDPPKATKKGMEKYKQLKRAIDGTAPVAGSISLVPAGGHGRLFDPQGQGPGEFSEQYRNHLFKQETFMTYSRDGDGRPLMPASRMKLNRDEAARLPMPVGSGAERGLVEIMSSFNAAAVDPNVHTFEDFKNRVGELTDFNKQREMLANVRRMDLDMDFRRSKVMILPIPKLKRSDDTTGDIREGRIIKNFQDILGHKYGASKGATVLEAREYLKEFTKYVDGKYHQDACYTLLKASTDGEPRNVVLKFSSNDRSFHLFWTYFCRQFLGVADFDKARKRLFDFREVQPSNISQALTTIEDLSLEAAHIAGPAQNDVERKWIELCLEEFTWFLDRWFPHLAPEINEKFQKRKDIWVASRGHMRGLGFEPDLYTRDTFHPVYTYRDIIEDHIVNRPQSFLSRPAPASGGPKAIEWQGANRQQNGGRRPQRAPVAVVEADRAGHSRADEYGNGQGQPSAAEYFGRAVPSRTMAPRAQSMVSAGSVASRRHPLDDEFDWYEADRDQDDDEDEVDAGDSVSQVGDEEPNEGRGGTRSMVNVHTLHAKPGQVMNRDFGTRPGGPPPRRPPAAMDRGRPARMRDTGAVSKGRSGEASKIRFCKNCGSITHDWDYCPTYPKSRPPVDTQCPICKFYHYGGRDGCKKDEVDQRMREKAERSNKKNN